MTNKCKKNRIKDFITTQDSYGLPISLTYNGDNTFKTFSGGVATMISRIAILMCFLYEFNEMVKNKKTITRKTNNINLVEDNSFYILNDTNYDIGIFVNINENELSKKVKADLWRYVDISFMMVKLSYQVKIIIIFTIKDCKR